MKTAMDSMLPNRRRQRADALTAAAMHELGDLLDIAARELEFDHHPDARRLREEVARRLRDLFMREGIEVISDYDREGLGLPPRGTEGWTADELIALERRRLDLMMRPLAAPFLPTASRSTASP